MHPCIVQHASKVASTLLLLEGGRVIGVEEGDGLTDAEAECVEESDSIVADNIGVVVVGDIVPKILEWVSVTVLISMSDATAVSVTELLAAFITTHLQQIGYIRIKMHVTRSIFVTKENLEEQRKLFFGKNV